MRHQYDSRQDRVRCQDFLIDLDESGSFFSDGTGTTRSASLTGGGECCTVSKVDIQEWEEALCRKDDQLRIKDARIRDLEEQLRRQGHIIREQDERLSELERRLGLNSSNSSKPPSSDGLRKLPASAKRSDASGEKAGGQKGHAGKTLRRTETPDRVDHHDPEVCAHALTEDMSVAQDIRQVHDLPAPAPLVVTDHIAHSCVCPACQGTTKAAFPDGVRATVQYGPHVISLAVSLNTYQLIPTKRLVETFRDLFGVPMCGH